MSELIFRYCPVCSKRLDTGKLVIPKGCSITDYVWWYSENNIILKRLNEGSFLFRTIPDEYEEKTVDRMNIPAGYCKKCDRIFAEF
ncbi:MAG: hypothetical protein K2J40_09950 [Ruminococcus sp.]|nr:hypothetical protein [Ruminococcus sp.]